MKDQKAHVWLIALFVAAVVGILIGRLEPVQTWIKSLEGEPQVEQSIQEINKILDEQKARLSGE